MSKVAKHMGVFILEVSSFVVKPDPDAKMWGASGMAEGGGRGVVGRDVELGRTKSDQLN